MVKGLSWQLEMRCSEGPSSVRRFQVLDHGWLGSLPSRILIGNLTSCKDPFGYSTCSFFLTILTMFLGLRCSGDTAFASSWPFARPKHLTAPERKPSKKERMCAHGSWPVHFFAGQEAEHNYPWRVQFVSATVIRGACA